MNELEKELLRALELELRKLAAIQRETLECLRDLRDVVHVAKEIRDEVTLARLELENMRKMRELELEAGITRPRTISQH